MKRNKRKQYKNMMVGASVMMLITVSAHMSNQSMDTAKAYIEQERLTKEEVMLNEIREYEKEQELNKMKTVYMSQDRMIELGLNDGDLHEIEGVAYVVRYLNDIEGEEMILD